MNSLSLQSPAKLNLVLKVLNKRPDDYHNLKTVFERIDLCDDITLTRNETGRIRVICEHPQVPKGPKNLVVKAARMLQAECPTPLGVDIKIVKRIPVAAGLAGGSTNAASVLKGLNRLWDLDLPSRKMFSYGRQLGADVPFFLADCSWGVGTERGDVIRPFSTSTKLWHVLVVPRVRMLSARVFANLKLQLTTKRDDVNILIRYIKSNNFLAIRDHLSNDLEPSILQICPRLARYKDFLLEKSHGGVSFSGSGPSVFAVVASKSEAAQLYSSLIKRYKQVFVARTL